ncbi:MAG: radical SAM protein [Geobacteraceae bacterium]|nr:radical SAM protein [Geobacteraceae bacterium]
MPLKLPDRICFRVSRCCNARCVFCLAPATGVMVDGDTLAHRIDWLLSHGVRGFDFCGGEPALHPELPRLLAHVHGRRKKAALTTNGIEMSDTLVSALLTTKTRVKVSLHGDRTHHNAMVGCEAFDRTTATIRDLLRSGIATSVQTTVVSGKTWVVDWLIDFCLTTGIRRLSILPFLPRGTGRTRQEHFALSTAQRGALHNHVTARRRALNGRLDLRWLNLSVQPIHVVEVDGSIILEGPTEARDRVICRIPAPAGTEQLMAARENDWS